MYKKHTTNLGKDIGKSIEVTEEDAWEKLNEYSLEAGRLNNLPLYQNGSKVFCKYNLFKDDKRKTSPNDEYMEKVKELKNALRIYARDDKEWNYVLANLKKPDYNGIMKSNESMRWVFDKLRKEKYASDEDNQKRICYVIDDLIMKMLDCKTYFE